MSLRRRGQSEDPTPDVTPTTDAIPMEDTDPTLQKPTVPIDTGAGQVSEPEPATVTETPTEASADPSDTASLAGMKRIKLLNGNVYDGKVIVIDLDTQEGYLIPKEKIVFQMGEQSVSADVLDDAERPYNWDDEIAQMYTTPQAIRVALWQSGEITPEETGSARAVVLKLIERGIVPMLKE